MEQRGPSSRNIRSVFDKIFRETPVPKELRISAQSAPAEVLLLGDEKMNGEDEEKKLKYAPFKKDAQILPRSSSDTWIANSNVSMSSSLRYQEEKSNHRPNIFLSMLRGTLTGEVNKTVISPVSRDSSQIPNPQPPQYHSSELTTLSQRHTELQSLSLQSQSRSPNLKSPPPQSLSSSSDLKSPLYQPLARSSDLKSPLRPSAQSVARSSDLKSPLPPSAQSVARSSDLKSPLRPSAQSVARSSDLTSPIPPSGQSVALSSDLTSPLPPSTQSVAPSCDLEPSSPPSFSLQSQSHSSDMHSALSLSSTPDLLAPIPRANRERVNVQQPEPTSRSSSDHPVATLSDATIHAQEIAVAFRMLRQALCAHPSEHYLSVKREAASYSLSQLADAVQQLRTSPSVSDLNWSHKITRNQKMDSNSASDSDNIESRLSVSDAHHQLPAHSTCSREYSTASSRSPHSQVVVRRISLPKISVCGRESDVTAVGSGSKSVENVLDGVGSRTRLLGLEQVLIEPSEARRHDTTAAGRGRGRGRGWGRGRGHRGRAHGKGSASDPALKPSNRSYTNSSTSNIMNTSGSLGSKSKVSPTRSKKTRVTAANMTVRNLSNKTIEPILTQRLAQEQAAVDADDDIFRSGFFDDSPLTLPSTVLTTRPTVSLRSHTSALPGGKDKTDWRTSYANKFGQNLKRISLTRDDEPPVKQKKKPVKFKTKAQKRKAAFSDESDGEAGVMNEDVWNIKRGSAGMDAAVNLPYDDSLNGDEDGDF